MARRTGRRLTALHPFLSLVFVALGFAGFAITAWHVKSPIGYYVFGSEVVLYGSLVAAGIGLYLGRAFGRLLALGWLRAGAWAFFLVPVAAVLWLAALQDGPTAILKAVGALVFAVLLLAASNEKAAGVPLVVYVAAAMAALAIVSFLCGRLYRRVAQSGAPAANDERMRARILALAFVAIALASQHRIMISDLELPQPMRSAQSNAQLQKWRDEALERLVGTPLVMEAGKGLVYAVPQDRLVQVDVDTGRATQAPVSRDAPKDPVQSVQARRSRFSPDGPLFWSNWTREIVDVRTGHAVKPALEDEWDRYLSIGFVDGSKRLLLFDGKQSRIVAIDTASGAVAYAVDATPAGGFSSDQNRFAHRERVIARGAFSRDRARLAWYYLDTLYVMETATGAIRSVELRCPYDSLVGYSSDDDHVLVFTPYDPRRGAMVDAATMAAVEHDIHATEVLHFSAGGGILARLPSTGTPQAHESRPEIARWALGNLASPLWTARLEARWHVVASADGKRLYAFDPSSHKLEQADIGALAGEAKIAFTPLAVDLPAGRVGWLTYVPLADGGALLVPTQSPRAAIVRLDASGGVASGRVVDFSAFAAFPK